MRTHELAAAALAITIAACAERAPEPSPRPTDCATLAATDTGVLIVRGSWRGKPVRIMVDTGAKTGAISPAIARRSTARPGERIRFAGASGAFRESLVYDVDRLEVAGRTLARFPAAVSATSDVSSGYDVRLGLDHLVPYVVEIDGSRDRFCLHDRAPDLDVSFAPMSFPHAGEELGDILVSATVSGVQLDRMILDTGAGISCVNEELLATFEHDDLAGMRIESVDASGARERQAVVSVPQLCVLGACEPDQQLMVERDLSSLLGYQARGIIGMPFWRRHRLILDFPRRRLALEPSRRSTSGAEAP